MISEKDCHLRDDRPAVGISSCLLGEAVRYDGGHKRDSFLADRLARFVDYVPRCPEAAIGLGVPREPIRLVQDHGHIGAHGVKSGTAVGERLEDYGREQAQRLTGLCGYVFKSRSPSCGLGDVPLFGPTGDPERVGIRGLYAVQITAALRWLPVEDEEGLDNPARRENFLVRLFTLHRFRCALDEPTAQALVDFHASHKTLLLAHDEPACRHLGRLAARAGSGSLEPLVADYHQGMMAALMRRADIGSHINALQHLAGHLRDRLDTARRAELARDIEAFRLGHAPWTAVRDRLRGHFARHADHWAAGQVYLAPYPDELAPSASAA